MYAYLGIKSDQTVLPLRAPGLQIPFGNIPAVLSLSVDKL